MTEPQTKLPPKLHQIVEDFALAEGSEKLELLLEYSQRLPVLPDHLKAKRDEMEQVHECMTPVFVIAERDDGVLRYYFDIPPEAPTVRGFAGVLGTGLDGTTPEQVLSVPGDFYEQMGLPEVLSPRRLNGVHAMLAYLKRLAARELDASPAA